MVATIALALSVASQIGPHFELQRVIVAILLSRLPRDLPAAVQRAERPATLRRALIMAPTLGILIVVYGYLGLRTLEAAFPVAGRHHAPRGSDPRQNPHHPAEAAPLDAHAARFLGSLEVAGWVARLYVLVLLLRPVVLRDRLEAPPEDVERIRRTRARRPLSAFALRPDKHHLLVAEGRGLVAYAVRNAVAVACGGPLCAPEDVEASVRDFVAHCHKHGWSPCFYAVPEEDLPGHAAARLKSLRIGEEGLLAPCGGRPAAAAGLEAWRYDRAAAVDTVLDEQIVEVSDDWLAERGIGELHFTFGSLDLEELAALPVFVCGQPGGRIEAFCTWLPYADGAGLTLNLLRRRRDAREGAREVPAGARARGRSRPPGCARPLWASFP